MTLGPERFGAPTASPQPAAIALDTPWRWVLLVACLVWMALVAWPPLATAFGWPAAELPRWFLQPICHQLPTRTPHLFGEPLAACHRCMGLYVGFTLGIAAWPRLPALAHKLAANPRWVAAFLVPLGIDWALLANTAASRFTTGALAAFPVALLALMALAERTNANGNRPIGEEKAGNWRI